MLKKLNKAFRIGYLYPYPVPAYNQFLDIRIRLKTHYLSGYPTGKPDGDRLWCARLDFVVCFVGVDYKFH